MRRFLLLLALVALVLAACGDDGTVTTDAGDDGDDDVPDTTDGDPTGLPDEDTEYWSVSVIEGGDERSLVAGTRISLHLGPDTVGASLGCNSMGGDAALVDGALVVSSLAMTEIGCDSERHEQDEWFADFLTASPAYALDGTTLRLETPGARIEFVERVVLDPHLPLEGTAWTVTGFVTSDAALSMTVDVPGSILFDAARSEASGFDGCNGFSVPFEVDEKEVRFGPVTKDEASCPESEDYQERMHAVLFSERVEWRVEHDTLTLTAPDGRGVTFTAG